MNKSKEELLQALNAMCPNTLMETLDIKFIDFGECINNFFTNTITKVLVFNIRTHVDKCCYTYSCINVATNFTTAARVYVGYIRYVTLNQLLSQILTKNYADILNNVVQH